MGYSMIVITQDPGSESHEEDKERLMRQAGKLMECMEELCEKKKNEESHKEVINPLRR